MNRKIFCKLGPWLGRKNVSEMTCSVSSGTRNLDRISGINRSTRCIYVACCVGSRCVTDPEWCSVSHWPQTRWSLWTQPSPPWRRTFSLSHTLPLLPEARTLGRWETAFRGCGYTTRCDWESLTTCAEKLNFPRGREHIAQRHLLSHLTGRQGRHSTLTVAQKIVWYSIIKQRNW